MVTGVNVGAGTITVMNGNHNSGGSKVWPSTESPSEFTYFVQPVIR